MKTMTRIVQLSALLIAASSVSSALACNTNAWLGGTSGAPVAGSPTAVSRVSGLCAMQLTEAGSVKDTNPTAEAVAYIRFYVKADLGSGAPTIFEAFSDDAATDSLITVTFDGGNFVFNAGNGASGSVPGKSGWNMIEMAWTGGVGMDYWVNVDSAETRTGTISAAAGTLESVILGSQAAIDGKLTFDDYESHRSTPVGGQLMGDSNASGSINVFDLISIQNEILGNALASGRPDCNLNGSVNVFDLICAQNIILGN